MIDEDKTVYFTTKAAAEYLGIRYSTLATYRWKGKGPAYYRSGRTCAYSKADLDEWAKNRRGTFNPALAERIVPSKHTA